MVQANGIAKKHTYSPYDFMITSDQKSLRYGIWYSLKEKPNGSILLLNGRREFMEKYSETIDELNHKGFNVYSLDWRGQGLSSRMLANRHKGFIDDYDVYLNDLNLLVTKIVKPESVHPLIIIAHSMGGHIALRFMHDHPEVADGRHGGPDIADDRHFWIHPVQRFRQIHYPNCNENRFQSFLYHRFQR